MATPRAVADGVPAAPPGASQVLAHHSRGNGIGGRFPLIAAQVRFVY